MTHQNIVASPKWILENGLRAVSFHEKEEEI